MAPFEYTTKKVSLDDLTIFNSQLASMVETELPLVPSLREIAKEMRSGKFKSVVEDVARDVESGNSLYDSLSRHPDTFSEFYLKLVDAGEKTGNLSAVLNELTKHSLRMLSFRRRVRDALIYPSLLAAMGLALITLVFTVVVPQFKEFYASFGRFVHLPPASQFIFSVSDLLMNHFPQIAAIVVALIVLIWFASAMTSQTRGGRMALDRIKMGLPLLGTIVRYVSIIHLSRTLGTLLSRGVPLVEALELAGRSSPNRIDENAVRGVVRSVEQGESLTSSLQKTGLFPPTMVWMLSIGERKGELAEYFLNNAQVYEERLENHMRRIEILVEPVMFVIIGCLVSLVIGSLFIPLIEASQTLAAF